MRATVSLRLLAPALVGLALLPLLAAGLPGFLAGGLSDAGGRLAAESRHREALDRRARATLEAADARRRVVRAVASGSLALAEAVARFRRIAAEYNAATAGVPGASPAPEEEEAVRRQVLGWVQELRRQ